MMIWRRGVVVAITGGWAGVQELEVKVSGEIVRALAYVDEIGRGHVGDQALLSTTALARKLGTGGFAFVVAFPDSLPSDPPAQPGHIVKARYTPLQTMKLGVDEEESPHHETLRNAESLQSMPVIVADLHSALPAIIEGIREIRPKALITYVMTDGGALPIAFSRLVAQLTELALLNTTITAGQAYGGDYEAVNIYTGLLAAKHVSNADVVIAIQGPGNLGTGTRWGFSGTAAGETLNATSILGGTPVGSLRISAADLRPRHYGVSHHSLTTYDKVALQPITVVVPDLPAELGKRVRDQVRQLPSRHKQVLESVSGLGQTLSSSHVRLATMGRTYTDDPTPFLAAAAAGRYVARALL